jgi:hypothetical protein
MRRVERRTLSGSVLEREFFTIAGNRKNLQAAEPLERFEKEQDRIDHRKGIARRRHEQRFNATFSPRSLYSTLTMDDEHEVHTFDEAGRMADNFMRRLKYTNPDAQIILYMGRGKGTNRIHFHMVSNGLCEDTIRAKWKAGSIVRIEHLRERNFDRNGKDIGQDYTNLANYLFGHWTEEQGGHYYKATRNLQKPDKKPLTPVKREYSANKPPRTPEGFRLIGYKSTSYGYQCFRYVREAVERPRHMRR